MAETREIAVGGFTFTVDIAGPAGGAPVLLLHGFPETRHMWRRQLDALAEAGFRAGSPQPRGSSA
jgi:pimeloyl-ACP methyl ester carboxylesterase